MQRFRGLQSLQFVYDGILQVPKEKSRKDVGKLKKREKLGGKFGEKGGW